jgi:hypothetical protein
MTQPTGFSTHAEETDWTKPFPQRSTEDPR